MPKKELKDQLESFSSYINDIPLVIDPCKLCKYIDKDKESHSDHIDVCKECSWYYPSKFEVNV